MKADCWLRGPVAKTLKLLLMDAERQPSGAFLAETARCGLERGQALKSMRRSSTVSTLCCCYTHVQSHMWVLFQICVLLMLSVEPRVAIKAGGQMGRQKRQTGCFAGVFLDIKGIVRYFCTVQQLFFVCLIYKKLNVWMTILPFLWLLHAELFLVFHTDNNVYLWPLLELVVRFCYLPFCPISLASHCWHQNQKALLPSRFTHTMSFFLVFLLQRK